MSEKNKETRCDPTWPTSLPGRSARSLLFCATLTSSLSPPSCDLTRIRSLSLHLAASLWLQQRDLELIPITSHHLFGAPLLVILVTYRPPSFGFASVSRTLSLQFGNCLSHCTTSVPMSPQSWCCPSSDVTRLSPFFDLDVDSPLANTVFQLCHCACEALPSSRCLPSPSLIDDHVGLCLRSATTSILQAHALFIACSSVKV